MNAASAMAMDGNRRLAIFADGFDMSEVNADNFRVKGATVGIPTVAAPNVGALTSASDAAGAAATSSADHDTARRSGIEPGVQELLEAAALHNTDAREAAGEPIAAARSLRARRFISEILNAPGLNAETLSTHLGMSRRQLYFLLARYGGVVKHIQNRRLAAYGFRPSEARSIWLSGHRPDASPSPEVRRATAI